MPLVELVFVLAVAPTVAGVLRLGELALRLRVQARLEEGRHRALAEMLDARPVQSLVLLQYPDGTVSAFGRSVPDGP